jgi:hypothetical protein
MQTIEQAIHSAAIRAALASYHGVADEPGAQIEQCLAGLLGAIPLRQERSYTSEQLKGRALTIVRGRYQSRTDLPHLPEPETAADVVRRMRRELERSTGGGRS